MQTYFPHVDIKDYRADRRVVNLVPYKLVSRYRVFGLGINDDTITLAIPQGKTKDELERIRVAFEIELGLVPKFVVSCEKAIMGLILKYYFHTKSPMSVIHSDLY